MRAFFPQKKQQVSAFFGWYDRKFGVVGFGEANPENIEKNIRLFYQDIFNGVLSQPRYRQLFEGNPKAVGAIFGVIKKNITIAKVILESMTVTTNHSDTDILARQVRMEPIFTELYDYYKLKYIGLSAIYDGVMAFAQTKNIDYIEKARIFLNSTKGLRQAIMS